MIKTFLIFKRPPPSGPDSILPVKISYQSRDLASASLCARNPIRPAFNPQRAQDENYPPLRRSKPM